MIYLDYNSIIAFIACIFFIFIVGKIFILPLKTILKFILNSVVGGIIIFIVNLIGGFWNFHIGLNILTSIIVGILGVPGTILVIMIKLLIG